MNIDEKKKEEGYKINGADQALVDKTNTTFTATKDTTIKDGKADNALLKYENITDNDKLISDKTWSAINKKFTTPKAVTDADAYLKGALSKIQSGKTSYSDKVSAMIDQIQGREKFSYDVDNDPLFQQALASAMNSGKSAMQDTIGQASALTGGYGSSYVTSAANQAYNAFVEDAYNNLPQYYQMALEAYQMEGDEMYRQLGMLNDADATEYSRMINAYDATGAYRDRLYNEAYQQFRDSKSDAFASANLQISEHGQLANDAFNLYTAYSNEADKAYEREYQQWSDSINNAWKAIGMQNADYWNQKDYEQTDKHFYDGLEHDSSENEKNREHDSAENKLNREHQATENQKNREHDTSEREASQRWQSSENMKDRATKAASSGGSGSQPKKDDSNYKILTNENGDVIKDEDGNPIQVKKDDRKEKEAALKAYNTGGTKGLHAYLDSLVAEDYDIEGISNYAVKYCEDWVEDYDKFSGFKIEDDTNNGGWFFGTNWFGAKDTEDHNDTFSKTYPIKGTYTWTYDELKDKINATNIPDDKKKELIDGLKKQSKK